MAAGPNVEELLRKLDEQHQLYLATFRAVHEALSESVGGSPVVPKNARRRRQLTMDTTTSEKPGERKIPPTYKSSVLTGESDESDDDGELYVQTPLSPYEYDEEDLRYHLKNHPFNEAGLRLLESVVRDGKLVRPDRLFPAYPPQEKWHNSHYSVFDVGTDGAPLSRSEVVTPGSEIDSAIWQAIQDLNAGDSTQRKAVGRITIVREPSPIILGALHLTMNRNFDMDEVFECLYEEGYSTAHVSKRAFAVNRRQQRSFIFKFDYYTIVERDDPEHQVEPMPWQKTDPPDKLIGMSDDHIQISRCSSVVALSLSGEPVYTVRNAARRAITRHGFVFDAWAPWHVLNIQCYPDHNHSMDIHDSTKHYVNGPEAFLHTLLAEFKDAEKRFEKIYSEISKLVSPKSDFMFDGSLRDKLLFEDDDFTYSRRYFWAFQTLGIMNNGIKAIIDSCEDTFTEDVWNGKNKSLWPMLDEASNRNVYWRKRMACLKRDFDKEIWKLKKLYEENDDRRKEIRTLRDQLFSGTSVLESRKSVELSEVTILQGHNIKLLTLVSIFFLPLTFVTSVFGMTNMPTDHQFKIFGVVMATVCVPFFLLIGSLNTTQGMAFWRSKWDQVLTWFLNAKPQNVAGASEQHGNHDLATFKTKHRSMTEANNLRIRMEQMTRPMGRSSSTFNRSFRTDSAGWSRSPRQVQRPGVTEGVAISQSGSSSSEGNKRVSEAARPAAAAAPEEKRLAPREPERVARSLFERVLRRKARDVEVGHEV